jgi:Ornithine decarboxylase antizyme
MLTYSSGGGEEATGSHSPPGSPPLAASYSSSGSSSSSSSSSQMSTGARRRGAAYTITEESERLFCDTMKSVFLGERKVGETESVVMDTFERNAKLFGGSLIDDFLELWDYRGDARFRGFVTRALGDPEDKTLVVFFDNQIVGKELKHA